jgi:hypothetical protein
MSPLLPRPVLDAPVPAPVLLPAVVVVVAEVAGLRLAQPVMASAIARPGIINACMAFNDDGYMVDLQFKFYISIYLNASPQHFNDFLHFLKKNQSVVEKLN